MPDFLLVIGYCFKRLFLKSGHDTCTCLIWGMWVKPKYGGFKFETLCAIEQFCHAHVQDHLNIKVFTRLCVWKVSQLFTHVQAPKNVRKQ